jgi:hypothetical protein
LKGMLSIFRNYPHFSYPNNSNNNDSSMMIALCDVLRFTISLYATFYEYIC